MPSRRLLRGICEVRRWVPSPSRWRRSRSPRSRACTTGPSAAFPWCPSGSATRTRHVLRTIATDAPRYVLRPLFELPLVVSSTGVGGWAEKASRPRGRSKSADGRLTGQVAIGSYEQGWQVGSRVATVSGLARER